LKSFGDVLSRLWMDIPITGQEIAQDK